MTQCKSILNKYGYIVKFCSYHTNDILKDYEKRKDDVSKEKFLTIFTPSGMIVGRIFDVTSEQQVLSKHHIEQIIEMFRMFSIESRNAIINDFKHYLEIKKENGISHKKKESKYY